MTALATRLPSPQRTCQEKAARLRFDAEWECDSSDSPPSLDGAGRARRIGGSTLLASTECTPWIRRGSGLVVVARVAPTSIRASPGLQQGDALIEGQPHVLGQRVRLRGLDSPA